MDTEHGTGERIEHRAGNGTRCPYCHGALEQVERHDWMMSLCRGCGGLWLEGTNLAQMIQQLHLTHLDSAQAFSALGTIIRRGRAKRAGAVRRH